ARMRERDGSNDQKDQQHGAQTSGTQRALGVRPSFPPEERHDVLALACRPLGELAAARTHWALRPVAEAANSWGYLRRPGRKSTVARWLGAAALKPHGVQRWLHSPAPEFRRKLRRVIRWYVRPPRGTRVICMDEKTQVQVLQRLHPSRPMQSG